MRTKDSRTVLRGLGGSNALRLPGNGALLDSLEAVIQYASTMTWKGKHPLVTLVTTTYPTGVKLTKQAMRAVETQLQRLPDLDKWFVDIVYPSPGVRNV
jgi:hypothetical protein